MSRSPLFLLIDQGGQSSRVSVRDMDGRERFHTAREVHTSMPAPGRVEQDPERMLTDLHGCIREALAAPGVDASSLVAAALAVQRGNVLCWERDTGYPLTPVLSWMDRRRPERALPEDIGERVRSETGLRHSVYGGAAKIRWCLEAVPEVAAALAEDRLAFGPLGTWLVRGLVARSPHRVDETLAQRTLLYSHRTRRWSPALLVAFGRPAVPLPTPVTSFNDFGPISQAGRALPLRLLTGDQNVVPCIESEPDPDCVHINLGTGAFVLRALPAVPCGFRPSPFQLTMLPTASAGQARYALEGSVHAAGSELTRLAADSGIAIADLPFDAALSRDTEAGMFMNTADGLGSPWWFRGRERRFIPAELTLAQRLAAVVENLVFLLRVNLELLEAKSGPSGYIVLTGGLSRNERLCQRLADGLGRRVRRLCGGEATQVGMWRCLSASKAPGPGYSELAPGPVPGLEARYRRWRRYMPSPPESG